MPLNDLRPLDTQAPIVADQRRFRRRCAYIPVTIEHSNGVVDGFVVNFSDSGALIQALKGILPLREECVVTFELKNKIRAEATVVRVNESTRQFAVGITHIITNGDLFLAFLLLNS